MQNLLKLLQSTDTQKSMFYVHRLRSKSDSKRSSSSTMSRSASFTMFNTPKPKPSGRISRQSTKSECFNDDYFADDLSHGFFSFTQKLETIPPGHIDKNWRVINPLDFCFLCSFRIPSNSRENPEQKSSQNHNTACSKRPQKWRPCVCHLS